MQSYIDLDDDDTKSESPDLGRSLYDVPPSYTGTPTTGTEALNTETIDRAVPSAAGAEKLYTEAADHIVPKSVAVSAVLEMETAVPVSKETSQSTQPIQFRTPQAATVVKDFAERFSKSKQDLACTLPRNPFQSVPNPRKEPYDIWDPIKTDTDSSQNQQNWRNSACTMARSKESVQLPPLNHAKKPLTNGDVGPPSLGTEELQSSVTYIHDGEQPFHPLLDNLQRNGDNTNLQVSTTKIRTLMGPPKIASMDVLGKRQTSSLTSLSQSAKANEKPRDVRVCRERPTGDVFDGATRVISSITVGREIKPPEERRSQEPIRPAGWSKEEAQHEQFDRKGKAEEDKSPSNTERELENVASMLERLDSALQANQPRNGERQSKADENEGKGEEKAKQQKDEMAQEKSRNGSLEAKEAKVQKQSEQKKAKEFIVMEQKTNVLEKDAKRLKTDQTTKSNGRQDAAKEVHKRTVTTEASARKDNEVTKSRRAELATQNTRKSSEPGRLKSSTPLSSSVSRETKIKSLTSYPGSGGSRSSSLSIEHANPPQETPSRGAKGEEKTPLTSALRKSPNTLGRPVSSISWADLIALPDSTILAKPAATVPSSKADKRTGSSPINSAGVAASNTRQPSVEIIRSSPAASIDTGQRKSRDPPKKTSTNIKKQTKLNVKRDVKQKGRVIDPPSPPKPAVEEALVLSSDTEDSVSTYYSDADDDVQEIGSTKAGPSSKKKTKSDAKVATAKAVIIQMTPPDSQIRAAKKATVKRATPTIGSATNSQPAKAITTAKTMPGPQGITTHQVPDKHAIPTIECTTGTQQSVATDTQSNASSRSPARYVSSTPSSTSRSSAKSDASAVSSSPPDIASEPSSQASLEMKSTPVGSRMGSSNSIKPKDVRATPSANQRLSSQSSTQETQDTHTLGVESAVDQQLQREARQFSEPAQVQVQSSAPITKSKVTKSNPQTKAMPNATPPEYPYTMSGPRPANFRFPSLSKLKNNPPKYDPKEHLKHASFMSSQKRDDSKPISSSQTNGVTHDDGSSSESDDESASSSDDDNSKATRNPFSSPVGSQLSMKSDGRNAKGLSSLVKSMFFDS